MTDMEADCHTKVPTTRHLITNNSLNSRIKSFRDLEHFESSGNILNKVSRKKGKKMSVAYMNEKTITRVFVAENTKKKFH